MSEPTSDGRQQPDPDHAGDPDENHDEVQDEVRSETPDPVFSDPTAPVWADPTAPIPAEPPPPTPPGPHPESDQPAAGPATPQANPPVAPPASNPYAQQPPTQPYGQPQPGQQYPAYGQQPYSTGPQSEANGSAIVLTILSGIVMLSTCFLIGIPSLIFGIMALSANAADPAGSRKKAKTGWIIFAINFAVVTVLAIGGFILLVAMGNSTSSSDWNY